MRVATAGETDRFVVGNSHVRVNVRHTPRWERVGIDRPRRVAGPHFRFGQQRLGQEVPDFFAVECDSDEDDLLTGGEMSGGPVLRGLDHQIWSSL